MTTNRIPLTNNTSSSIAASATIGKAGGDALESLFLHALTEEIPRG